jgi:hypothetical protein
MKGPEGEHDLRVVNSYPSKVPVPHPPRGPVSACGGMRVCVGLCVGWGVCVWQVLLRRAQGLPAVLCTNWNWTPRH